ncbi:MAG: DUF5659 domain-containing protein [Patescibacteria group bacterium]
MEVFKTNDMHLAITLQALNQPMIDIEPGVKKTFVFPDSEKLRHFTERYWNRALKVEPQVLWINYKIVKNRLNAC